MREKVKRAERRVCLIKPVNMVFLKQFLNSLQPVGQTLGHTRQVNKTGFAGLQGFPELLLCFTHLSGKNFAKAFVLYCKSNHSYILILLNITC